jgi:uncharacterized protein YyaL (SSP411 family)
VACHRESSICQVQAIVLYLKFNVMNRLAKEKSSYLRHASYQKIDWYPWSEEAFERAKNENKPVFLSSGAVWCHWCHVMAKECFENDEIANILNEEFICIKLDRDERPDIDRRYQYSVQVMGMGGGWPLSVFLTPDKKPFYGGTYFPPEDSFGRPGFKKVLKIVSDYYKKHRSEIDKYTEKLLSVLKQKELPLEEISEDKIDKGVDLILSAFDPQNGGFGTAPKFPMPGAIEFLINRYYFTRNETIGHVLISTLNAMAKGGIHDQIGGGFHRYSTDEAWIIPHFEKLADDNAWLLRNYIYGYALFGDEYFKEVAEGIIRFINDVLLDEDGCFYASQDADITPDDEGGYFTWTDDEIKAILNEEEYAIFSMHYFDERGFMHHHPSKRVLFVSMDEKDIASSTGRDINEIKSILSRAKKKVLTLRNAKKSPFVDKNIYTSFNGMLISAYLRAYRILKDEDIKNIAIKNLERIMNFRLLGDKLFHADDVEAMLDDYIYLIDALVNAYEVTGSSEYLKRAEKLMDITIERLWDKDRSGFFDSENPVLGIRIKAIEDIPHPSSNSLAISLLLKLFHLTDRDIYLKYAELALKGFSAQAYNFGINAAYYFCSLDHYYRMLRFAVHGEGELTFSLIHFYRPYITIRYEKPDLTIASKEKQYVVPCLKKECYEAIYTLKDLDDFLKFK